MDLEISKIRDNVPVILRNICLECLIALGKSSSALEKANPNETCEFERLCPSSSYLALSGKSLENSPDNDIVSLTIDCIANYCDNSDLWAIEKSLGYWYCNKGNTSHIVGALRFLHELVVGYSNENVSKTRNTEDDRVDMFNAGYDILHLICNPAGGSVNTSSHSTMWFKIHDICEYYKEKLSQLEAIGYVPLYNTTPLKIIASPEDSARSEESSSEHLDPATIALPSNELNDTASALIKEIRKYLPDIVPFTNEHSSTNSKTSQFCHKSQENSANMAPDRVYTLLLFRLRSVTEDLQRLIDYHMEKTLDYDEANRLQGLLVIINQTIAVGSDVDGDAELVYGHERIQSFLMFFDQGSVLINQLELALWSERQNGKFNVVNRLLCTMRVLKTFVGVVKDMISSVSFLAEGIWGKIVSETARSATTCTSFINFDYIFKYIYRADGYSIGGLIILCTARRILQYIHEEWHHLNVFTRHVAGNKRKSHLHSVITVGLGKKSVSNTGRLGKLIDFHLKERVCFFDFADPVKYQGGKEKPAGIYTEILPGSAVSRPKPAKAAWNTNNGRLVHKKNSVSEVVSLRLEDALTSSYYRTLDSVRQTNSSHSPGKASVLTSNLDAQGDGIIYIEAAVSVSESFEESYAHYHTQNLKDSSKLALRSVVQRWNTPFEVVSAMTPDQYVVMGVYSDIQTELSKVKPVLGANSGKALDNASVCSGRPFVSNYYSSCMNDRRKISGIVKFNGSGVVGDGDTVSLSTRSVHGVKTLHDTEASVNVWELENFYKELQAYCSVAALAKTKLLHRLHCFSEDIVQMRDYLVEHGGSEPDLADLSDHFHHLYQSLTSTIEADTDVYTTSDGTIKAPDVQLACGQERLSTVQHLISQTDHYVGVLGKERSETANLRRDYISAKMLDELRENFEICATQLKDATMPATLFPDERVFAGYIHQLHGEECELLTSEFYLNHVDLLQYKDSHNLLSLAVLSSAYSILNYIKCNWPQLSSISTMAESFEPSTFRDAVLLRDLGIPARILLISGAFTDVDILTAGYGVEELKHSGYSVDVVVHASRLPEENLRNLHIYSHSSESHALYLFYHSATNGDKSNKSSSLSPVRAGVGSGWRRSDHWELFINETDDNHTFFHRSTDRSKHAPYGVVYYDPVIDDLTYVQKVKSLVLTENNIKGIIPMEIAALQYIQHIVLSDNFLSGGIPDSITTLKYLKSLQLQNNQITGEIPFHIGELESLEVLNLENNRMHGFLPDSLCNILSLKRLLVSNNQFSGPIPFHIGNLRNLEDFSAHENQLLGDLPESIYDCTKLVKLSLFSNNLSGFIPVRISNLKKLACLFLHKNMIANQDSFEVNRHTLQKLLPTCKITLDQVNSSKGFSRPFQRGIKQNTFR